MFNLQATAPEWYVYQKWTTYRRSDPCQSCLTPYFDAFTSNSDYLPDNFGHYFSTSRVQPRVTPTRSLDGGGAQLDGFRSGPAANISAHLPFSQLVDLDNDDLKSRVKDPELLDTILAYKQGIQFSSSATHAGLPISPGQASYTRTPDHISRLGSNQQSWTNELSPREGSAVESDFSTDGSVLENLVELHRESNTSFDFTPVLSPTLPSGSFDRNGFECLFNTRGEEYLESDMNIFSSDAVTNDTVFQFPETHTNELLPAALYHISDSVSNSAHVPLNLHPSRNGVEQEKEEEEAGFPRRNELEEPWNYLECVAEPSRAMVDGNEPVIAPKPLDTGLQVEIPQLLLRSRRVFRSQVVYRNTRSTLSMSSNDVNISADAEVPSWRAIKRACATAQQQGSLVIPLVPLPENDMLGWAKHPKRLKGLTRKRHLPFPEPELVSLPATRGEKMAKLRLGQAMRFKHQLTR